MCHYAYAMHHFVYFLFKCLHFSQTQWDRMRCFQAVKRIFKVPIDVKPYLISPLLWIFLNELSQIYRKHENNISSLNGMGGARPMGGGEWENIYMNQISC